MSKSQTKTTKQTNKKPRLAFKSKGELISEITTAPRTYPVVWKGFTWFFKTCFDSKLTRKHTVARVAHVQCIVLVVKCEVTLELQNKTNSVPLKRNAQGCTDGARGNPPWHRGGGVIT